MLESWLDQLLKVGHVNTIKLLEVELYLDCLCLSHTVESVYDNFEYIGWSPLYMMLHLSFSARTYIQTSAVLLALQL